MTEPPIAISRGYDLISSILRDKQDAVRQVLDQDPAARLVKVSGADHAYRLRLADGHSIILQGRAGSGKTGDPNVMAAFKSDLRRHGYVIDGLSTAAGVAHEDKGTRNVETARGRRYSPPPVELSPELLRELEYGEQILAVVDEVNARYDRECTEDELIARLAHDLHVPQQRQTAFAEQVRRECGELHAHEHVQRRPRRDQSGFLYSPPGWRPAPLPVAAGALRAPEHEDPDWWREAERRQQEGIPATPAAVPAESTETQDAAAVIERAALLLQQAGELLAHGARLLKQPTPDFNHTHSRRQP